MKKYTAEEFKNFMFAIFIILWWLGWIMNLIKFISDLFLK